MKIIYSTLAMLTLAVLLFGGKAQAQNCGAAIAGFSVSPLGMVQFWDSSYGTNGIVSWQWNFGDGNSSTQQNPTHFYNGMGPYQVCLTITDGTGCVDSTCITVVIAQQGNCQADFVARPDTGAQFIFLDTSFSGGGTIVSWQWNFGDGSVITAQTGQPQFHTYTQPGTYTVCLTITDNLQCTSTTCQTITVGSAGSCVSDFSFVVDTNNNVSFTDLSTSPDGIASWFWSFGFGTGSSQQNPTQNFQPGVYTVCLTITDSAGCSNTACSTVLVNSQQGNCQAAFWADSIFGPAGTGVLFTDFSSSSSNIVSWSWDFGDSTVSSQQHPYHVYQTGGTYLVCLTIVDANQCSSTTCQLIYVANTGCAADFSYALDSATGEIAFTDLSSSQNSGIQSWNWYFGDGSFSTDQNPVHTYANGYLHQVCLTIQDSAGCYSTHCQLINTATGPIQDLKVSMYHITTVTPGFPRWSRIYYYNDGTMPMSGTVEYAYDPNLTFVSSFPAPSVHDPLNHLLIYNFTGLAPFASNSVRVDFDVPTTLPLGTAIFDTAYVNPVAGDVTPANNVVATIDTCVGSWDPNDKAVSPMGLGDEGIIDPTVKDLHYLIRFQNTGTAPAVNVVVRDTLDADLDISTLAIRDVSHPYVVEMEGNNILIFRFNNIMLPDSNTNEPASHGFINFEISIVDGSPLGTEIHNTAAIYFDFNPPVITNTVVNTIAKATGIKNPIAIDFDVYPNPASDRLIIALGDLDVERFSLQNLLGQELVTVDEPVLKTLELNTTQLENGLYIVSLETSQGVVSKRVLIRHD